MAAVTERSGGNPYLTELLTEGLDPRADELPRTVPADLANALLAAWHRLSATTRDVVRSLAVAGRPTNGQSTPQRVHGDQVSGQDPR